MIETPMKILVTAFGPFGGRDKNASSLTLVGLKNCFPKIQTRILPVDAVIAPSRLKQALKSIQPDAVILLGEAGGSKNIRLETTAWNELDFRIPDVSGRQITSRPINAASPSTRSSSLPLAEILAGLDAAGHKASFSDDPGRYLCNQVFYQALETIEQRSMNTLAGFIHLPLETDYPTERAVDAISHVIRLLVRPPA
jgi:pyroglutamyl-peptidase